MAKNLRAKIPASDTLIIRDVNPDSTKRFVEESQEIARNSGAGGTEVGRVEVAENTLEVAEKSVGRQVRYSNEAQHDEQHIVLSMI